MKEGSPKRLPNVGQEIYYEFGGKAYLGVCTDTRGKVTLKNCGSVVDLPEYVEVDGELQLPPNKTDWNKDRS